MIDFSKLGFIFSDTSRSRAYLQILISKNIFPKVYVLIESNDPQLIGKPKHKSKTFHTPLKYGGDFWSFDPDESVITTLNKRKLDYVKLNVQNINDPKVIPFLKTLNIENLIYSGAGGIILKKELFDLSINFIHAHGGLLPNYQGSTCNFYSIIEENLVAASVIIMNEKIDDGPIIHKIELKPDFQKDKMDHYFDPLIRAIAIVKAFECNPTLKETDKRKVVQNSMYFVIHPVLKHIAILK
jgi:methionyl-tRNA formyltransferase